MAKVAGESTENEMTSGLLQLEALKERDLSEIHHQILNIIAYGITTGTQEAATEAAVQLDALCPPLDQYQDAQDYMWAIWEMMMDVAGSYEVAPDVQQGVIRILQVLQQIAKGDVNIYGVCCLSEAFQKRVWRDLPLLSVCFKDSFNDPTSDPAQSKLAPKSARAWRKINRFGAFCFTAGILGPYAQSMYALRSALEEELSPIPEVAECRLQVACDWILHGASPLLWWAQENIGYADIPVEDTAAYTPGGVLYEGPQTMCLRRWGFWMQRLESLGHEMEGSESGLSEEARREALKAVENMRTVEGRIGHSL